MKQIVIENRVLAKRKEDLKWYCTMCTTVHEYKLRMLDHVRFDHIKVE